MTKQPPTPAESENAERPLNLSEFLRYPETHSKHESAGAEVTLTQIRMPDFHPIAAEMITRLKEATVTVEVLEVFHDLFRMYCRGQLIIDVEACDDWPDFYEEYLRLCGFL